MFEELIFMFGFVIISALSSYTLLRFAPEPLYTIIKFFAIIGIVIHELTHVLMCLISRTPIKHIVLVEKVNRIGGRKGEFNYGGKVLLDDISKITFLQALLVSLAPIYVSFWLFFLLLEQILLMKLDVLLFYLSIFIMVSIFLASAPSFADISMIPKTFMNNPTYSLYQTLLLGLSFGTIWLISTIYQIVYFHELIIYSMIFLTYYIIKYISRGIYVLSTHFIKRLKIRRSDFSRISNFNQQERE